MAPAETALSDQVGQVLNITVVCAPEPRVIHSVAFQVPVGASLRDAIHLSGVLEQLGLEGLPSENGYLNLGPYSAGIWGKTQNLDTPLRDRDRIELTRGLRVDPKEARRQRYRKQGNAR